MQHFSSTAKYWNLWQGNGLNSLSDISLTRLKCWNFQNTISEKKLRYFSEVICFIYCRYADGMQHFSSTAKYWNLWQGNGLNSLSDISLTRLKCWNFQNTISEKKLRYFSEVICFIYLSCPLKFFFSIFSSGNHFVQKSKSILAILAKEHKRNIDVNLFWNLASGHRDVI